MTSMRKISPPETRDEWFEMQYGPRPQGDVEAIARRLRDLRSQVTIEELRLRELLDWEMNRRAVLLAWLAFSDPAIGNDEP